MNDKLTQVDTKELELPDTLFIRDIDSKVFQTIALQALLNIEGVSILEGNLIDSFFGRDGPDRIKGIYVEQDLKNHAVTIKIEVNVAYGVALPEKADEIQNKVAHEVSRLTGLHVSCVHVVFKNLVLPKQQQQQPMEEHEEKAELAYLEDFE
jgi:uncharacterized alkaline shock family protein YloU